MNIETIEKRIFEELDKLHLLNSAFNPDEVDEDDVWKENLLDSEWKGKVAIGSLSNYLLFVENKEDGYYLSVVCETEPLMITNNWLFGKGVRTSECNYEFSGSAFDVAADYSFDEAESLYEVKL